MEVDPLYTEENYTMEAIVNRCLPVFTRSIIFLLGKLKEQNKVTQNNLKRFKNVRCYE